MAQQVPPLTCPLKFGAVPRYRVRNFLVSAAIPTGLDCAGLCWTGPLALMGIMCSGLRVEATPLTVPKRLHSLHPHGTATHVERSLQALSQDVPEHERCEDDKQNRKRNSKHECPSVELKHGCSPCRRKGAALAARRSGDKAKLKKILAARQIASALTAGRLDARPW